MKPKNLKWSAYIRIGIGRRLSLLGERLNIHWLIYNPIHFMHFHESALSNAPGVMRTFEALFPNAKSYVDVGAGSGAYAAEAQRRGRRVLACEHSPKGRRIAAKQGVDCRPFDLAKDPYELHNLAKSASQALDRFRRAAQSLCTPMPPGMSPDYFERKLG